MLFWDTFKCSYRNIKAKPFESFFVALGIALSILVLCSVFGLIGGINESNYEYRTAIRFREFLVTPTWYNYMYNISKPVEKVSVPLPAKIELTYEDYFALKQENIESLDWVTFIAVDNGLTSQIPYDLINKPNLIPFQDIDIYAGNEESYKNLDLTLIKGDYYREEDLLKKNKVIVLGTECAKTYYGNKNPIGRTFFLEKRTYTVIGLVNNSTDDKLNRAVFVPYFSYYDTNVIKSFKVVASKNANLNNFYSNLNNYIETKYAGRVGINASAFQTRELYNSIYFFIKTVGIFSCTVLLVAAINLINLMMARVLRRSKQIGISIALGASRKNIFLLFLTESCVLGLKGVSIGFVITYFVMNLVKQSTNLPIIISPSILLSGMTVAIFFSILFGFYPAFQASKINPIESINTQ